MKLSELLTASKQAILKDGWCAGHRNNGRGEHCALGGIDTGIYNLRELGFISGYGSIHDAQVTQYLALYEVLKERFETGTLPVATYGSCMMAPNKWADLFIDDRNTGTAICQFNNSTSEKDVLDLFDVAINRAKANEGAAAVEKKEEKQHDLETV